ncbi:addiction module toxin, Txe/YoeB family [Hymenobacter roseosalivarius DSM 11622]|uniref:Putative mRNA interferase YoeB n=1 Tax=Hymenobacter roseosalivarius DSM 11622 TaxID=645990 RepID=A0A1W1W0L5_9BACT|nr:Txe/YoeB family addiction module toxin [Hymenobacter roseosalivarius]SMB99138.1 addiction module toxin, Txe/YoeB family [Hymenobacter roseosalivarius DSM 11622]
MRNVVFSANSFEHYQYWQETDQKILRKLNQLLRECQRMPFAGTGKPEPLKGELAGLWSRRITQEHRLVYRVDSTNVFVASCRYHYEK